MTTLDTRPRPPPWPALVVVALVVLADLARCAAVDTHEPGAENLGPMRIPLVALVSLLALLAACREPEPEPELPDAGEACKTEGDDVKPCKIGLICNTGDGFFPGGEGHCAANCDGDADCEDGQFCSGEGACTWRCSPKMSCPAAQTEVTLACVPAEGGASQCVGAF